MTDVKNHAKRNQIKNCDIAVDDVVRAEQIHGKAVPESKGKFKRVSPENIRKCVSNRYPRL